MRRAARRDENHGSIRAVFESLDCSILDVASCPCGFDLIVGYKTQVIPVEIKNPAMPPSKQRLTENEALAHLRWKGPKAIVTNNDEAVAVVELLRRRHFYVMDGINADALGA